MSDGAVIRGLTVPNNSFLRRYPDLLACMAVALLEMLLSAFGINTLFRVFVGGVMVLFVPGYALCSVLWPPHSRLSFANRLIFSVGLSASSTVFMVLLLSVIGAGIYAFTLALALGYLALAFSVLGMALRWTRREGIPPEVRDAIGRGVVAFKEDRAFWSIAIALMSLLLVIVILIAATPAPPLSSQFYLLGTDGTVTTLPSSLTLNQSVAVIVGIYNGQRQEFNFNVTLCLVRPNATCSGPVIPASWGSSITLAAAEEFELNVTVPGENTVENRLTFLVPISGSFTLEFAMDGGGAHLTATLPLTVA